MLHCLATSKFDGILIFQREFYYFLHHWHLDNEIVLSRSRGAVDACWFLLKNLMLISIIYILKHISVHGNFMSLFYPEIVQKYSNLLELHHLTFLVPFIHYLLVVRE